MGGSGMAVVGIGTVELPVKRKRRATGPQSHGILRLRNVLHIPTAVCNVIGGPILDDYNVIAGARGENTKGTISDEQGRAVAYFDPGAKFYEVKLSGPPVGPRVGPTPFDTSSMYYINVLWPDSERRRWEAERAAGALRPAAVPLLSAEEKRWLKEHWGGEFKFLASYGLNIYKEEDREEGRVILRAMMADSDGDDN